MTETQSMVSPQVLSWHSLDDLWFDSPYNEFTSLGLFHSFSVMLSDTLWILGAAINDMSPAAGQASNHALIQYSLNPSINPIFIYVTQADIKKVKTNDMSRAKINLCFMVFFLI